MSRANKLRALSRDPGATEGERQAAAEALERHERANPTLPPPERHTREWFALVGLFRRRVDDLHCRAGALMPLGNPPLSWPEYRILKNMARNGADPFNGADVSFIETVERKLSERGSRGDAEQNETIALAYEPGITVDDA
ncbi:hypothetical protein BFX40_23655 [Mesorhizobium sp. SEMIA 3007]|uniref:hypothetical protein n=1 Tax=Mesorhizobium sp. SEMIA 3007 TaxID=1862350 RepID=UPI00083D7E81|nr:hypothetical protein [Mesorhizobium sp. SEMIA 3007]ODA95559.1 hypothetical protein BFX40_23655 [Mesorhizobium sp. SEMIA 3007]